jgi:cell division septation protein DedD
MADDFFTREAGMPLKQNGPNSLKAGDVLARRYVILRHLRDEPCGGVWLAQDRLLEVDVGLKFIPRRSPQFEAVREALRREGALSLKFRHPHILHMVHFEEGEEGVYLIQEPFPGESLLAHLNRQERFHLPHALSLLEQVAQALAFVHEHNEVHHALDPCHILLDEHIVKVANFACDVKDEEDRVTHLELKAYTAPEVIQGESVTPAANVFSLGVLGFRLAAGSLPYALTFDEPFPYRLESVPLDLEEIPLPLQNLLLQCLAPDPGDRFEDAGVFLATLEQRREEWRTSSHIKWFGWTPARRSETAGIMGTAARIWGQFWEGTKGAAGKIVAGLQSLKETGEPGMARRLLLGLAGAVLLLIILVWGGRALFQKIEATSAPAPSPATATKVKLPKAGGPPLNVAKLPTSPRRRATVPPKAAPSAPEKKVKASAPAQPKKDRYQLLVISYLTYNKARALKKRIQAKKLPASVRRVTVKKKNYYVVKAGPFSGKKQAEKVAQRLKSELKLAQAPKIVKIKTASLKTSSRKPR